MTEKKFFKCFYYKKPLENYLITSFNDIEFKFYLMSANSEYKLKSFLFLSLKPNKLNISENL